MSSLTDVPPAVQGTQEPRLSHVPVYLDSSGSEAIEVAERAGLFLDPWQQLVLLHSLGERSDGKWAAANVGLVVPRQNGKGSILEARELAGLFLIGERVIVHSAHEQATASEQFRRLLDLIEGVPEFDKRVLKAPKGKGNEAIELRGGQRIFFKTRTSGGGRGFTSDCLIYDEAMILPEAFVSAVSPSLAARSLLTATGVQTWYVGSAVDQLKHDGLVFARIRERGHKGDPRTAWFEWSCDFGDPSKLTLEDLYNRELWAQANPSLEIRIASEYVESEIPTLGPRGFAIERLSVGDWPDTSGDGHRAIDMAKWAACEDETSQPQRPVCFAFDVTPDRSTASISLGGIRSDGLPHLEVVEHKRGTGWVAGRLFELKAAHKPHMIICDAGGPAGALVADVERALGGEVYKVTAGEHAQAFGMFFDDVQEEGLRHGPQDELVAALRGAKTRPMGRRG